MNLFKLLFPIKFKILNSLYQDVRRLEKTQFPLVEYIFKDWKTKNAERFNFLINEELFDFTSYDSVNGFKDLKKFKVSIVSESALFFKESNIETTAFRTGYFKQVQLRYEHEDDESFEEYKTRMLENPYAILEVPIEDTTVIIRRSPIWISEQKLIEIKTKTELFKQITANANSEKKEEENS